MTRTEFWGYVKAARQRDGEAPEEGLRETLEVLSLEEIASFQQHFDELVNEAYRWDLWGAAYLINGGCSDDGFVDFRYGLISQGQDVYEAALRNPDSLTDIDDEIANEGYGYVATQVFEDKDGGEIDRASSGPSEPVGEAWDFDDDGENRRRLPRLFARYGNAA